MLLRMGGKQVIKWTAEGAVNNKSLHDLYEIASQFILNLQVFYLVFCNVRHTSVARDMLVSHKSTARAVNQGGTADSFYSSLTEDFC